MTVGVVDASFVLTVLLSVVPSDGGGVAGVSFDMMVATEEENVEDEDIGNSFNIWCDGCNFGFM